MINTTTATTRPIVIDQTDQGYTIDGQAATETEVNKTLNKTGLRVSADGFETLEGTPVTGLNVDAVTTFGGPIPLTDPEGPVAPLAEAAQRMDGVKEMGLGALMFHALYEMARMNQNDAMQAKQIRNAMQQGKRQAKMNQIESTVRQIEGEREAAWDNFGWSVAGAVVSFAAAGYGATGTDIMQSGMAASATALGGAVTAYGQLYTKTTGGQAKVDAERIRQKQLEAEESSFDEMIDDARSNYEQATEQFKLALRIISEHMERQSSAVQRFTS